MFIHCPVDELCDQPIILWTSTEPTHLDRLLAWTVRPLNPPSHDSNSYHDLKFSIV